MRCFLAQLVLVAGLRLATQTTSPVEKVVQLIEELKSKIEADGANEQKIYNKFACWCETTTARKANDIESNKATIGVTTTNVLTLKGDIAVLASEIADNTADKTEEEAAIRKFTAIREKENGDYQANKNYQETTISSLHQAIEVLNGAGTGMALLKVAANVRSAILGSPHLSMLSDTKARVMKTFLEEGVTSRAPQSATVMGILKDMYDTFAADLEASNTAESKAQMEFEALVHTKEQRISMLKGMNTAANTNKASKSEQLAAASQLLEATQDQLKADEELFVTTRDSCKAKSDSWDERVRLRTEELTGISKALEILTSDDARKTFGAAATRPQDTFGSAGVDVAFLQLDMEHSPQQKAYKALKKVIGTTHRMSFARLAVAIRTSATGHFDDVMGSIDDMDETLKTEEKGDITQRDWCIDTRDEERATKDDQTYEIKQLNTKIERSELEKANLEKDLAKTRQDKVDLTTSMDEAGADRIAENEAFHAAKDDDTTAVGLLEDAIAAMSNYGNNNAPAAFVQKEPVFEVSEDQAPDAQFSDQGKHDGATGGIVALLTQIKENLENEVALAIKAEAKAVEDHDTLVQTSVKQHEAYDLQITQLEQSISNADEAILANQNSEDDEDLARDDTKAYLKEIKPKCDFIQGSFTERVATRKAESEGLQQAKAILAGSEGGSFGFLQKS